MKALPKMVSVEALFEKCDAKHGVFYDSAHVFLRF